MKSYYGIEQECRIRTFQKLRSFMDTVELNIGKLIEAGATEAEVEEFIEWVIQSERTFMEKLVQNRGV